jgi:predicted nucleic acid-binding protein
VIVLDAYALIAFLVGGPAAPQVRALLREGDVAVSTANLAETLDVSRRLYGLPVHRGVEAIEPLLDGPLATIPLDVRIACRAAEVRSTHYHRTTCPISLADAILVASARSGDRIATSDPHLLEIVEVEHLEAIALPGQG